ncbi:MAG: hypothetical protein OXL40_05325 [Bacteroidota bacterium]|nr:hypothetical protein [Bacteroidota bacterium]
MSNDWIKPIVTSSVALIIAICAGMWTVFVHLDAKFDQIDVKFDQMETKFDVKFDQIDARLNGIDTRLARVEGWIEGRFENTSAETISINLSEKTSTDPDTLNMSANRLNGVQ